MTAVAAIVLSSWVAGALLAAWSWAAPGRPSDKRWNLIPMGTALVQLAGQFTYVLSKLGGEERVTALWHEDSLWHWSFLTWSIFQMGIHILVQVQKSQPLPHLGWCHAFVMFCGGTVAAGMALTHVLWLLPAGTALLALALPLILGGRNFHAVEAGLKAFFDLRFAFLFFGLALALGNMATGSLDPIRWANAAEGLIAARGALLLLGASLFVLLGQVPFHMNRVDLLTGGKTVGSLVLFFGQFLMTATVLLRTTNNDPWRLTETVSDPLLGGLCLASFLLSGMSALDQRTLNRILAYLLVGNLALLLPLLYLVSAGVLDGMLIQQVYGLWFSLGAGTLLIYFAFVPLMNSTKEPLTWETCSGIGLTEPFLAFGFLLGLANISGLPGTLGFGARISLAQKMFEQGAVFSGWAILASIPLQSMAVLRLASFFFYEKRQRRRNLDRPVSLKLGMVLFFGGLVFGGFGYWFV